MLIVLTLALDQLTKKTIYKSMENEGKVHVLQPELHLSVQPNINLMNLKRLNLIP